jgi:hypothetical protein
MRRIALKTLLYAVLWVGAVLCLSGCIEPVDLDAFSNDKEVKSTIEEIHVDTLPDSEPGLKEGKSKITGLDPLKYYMIEEYDKDISAWNVQFVQPDGTRSINYAKIGAVTGGEITGLSLYNWFRVTAAKPLAESGTPYDVPYLELTQGGGGVGTIDEGAITLPAPSGTDTFIYYLTPPSSLPGYEIAEVPVSPPGSTSAARRLATNQIITLISQGTEIDYVFYRETAPNTYDFYVLKVKSDDSIPITPGVDVTVIFKFLDGVTPDIVLTRLAGAPLPSLPAQGTRSGFTPLGWFESDGSAGGGSGSGWGNRFTTYQGLISDKTVYARWLKDGEGTGGMITIPPLGGTPIQLTSGSTLILNSDNVPVATGGPLTITMTNASNFTTRNWYYGSTTLTETTTGTITLNSTTTPGTAAAGKFLILVTGETALGEHQSFWFTVTVGP